MIFQQERFSRFCQEALPLFVDHHKEVNDIFDEGIEFDPNVEAFIKLDDNGALRVFTVRDGSELIGYCIHHVYKHLHFRNSLQSIQDAIYIAKKHRGIGKQFISWVDDQLKSEGVDAVYHSVSLRCDYSKALVELGYEKFETNYVRRLH